MVYFGGFALKVTQDSLQKFTIGQRERYRIEQGVTNSPLP